MQQRYLCLIHWRFPHTCPPKRDGLEHTEAAKRKEQHKSSLQFQPSALASSGKPQKTEQQCRQVHTAPASQKQQQLSRQLTEGQRGLGPHPSGRWGTHNSGPLPRRPTPVEPTNLRKSDDHYQQWQSLQPRGVQTSGKSPPSQRTGSEDPSHSGSSKAPMTPRPRKQ